MEREIPGKTRKNEKPCDAMDDHFKRWGCAEWKLIVLAWNSVAVSALPFIAIVPWIIFHKEAQSNGIESVHDDVFC